MTMDGFAKAQSVGEQDAGEFLLEMIAGTTLSIRDSDGLELAQVESQQIRRKQSVRFKRPGKGCARIDFLLFQELGGTRVSGEYDGMPFLMRVSHDGTLHWVRELGNLDPDDRKFFRSLLGILVKRLKKRTAVRVNRYGVAAINALNDLAKSDGCPEFLHCALSYVALVGVQPAIVQGKGNCWSSGVH
jgi:hypothetical protein